MRLHAIDLRTVHTIPFRASQLQCRRARASEHGCRVYDGICSLIGQKLLVVGRDVGVHLEFIFSGGDRILVSLREEDAVGPEAAALLGPNNQILVENYAH